jgi:hypothetical protein
MWQKVFFGLTFKNDPSDQEAGENKKHIHSHPAEIESLRKEVEEDDCESSEPAYRIEFRHSRRLRVLTRVLRMGWFG